MGLDRADEEASGCASFEFWECSSEDMRSSVGDIVFSPGLAQHGHYSTLDGNFLEVSKCL